jgi:hypothetical protein
MASAHYSYRTLLYEHHEFFYGANPFRKASTTNFSFPCLPGCGHTAFIFWTFSDTVCRLHLTILLLVYLAYSMLALLYETVPLPSWIIGLSVLPTLAAAVWLSKTTVSATEKPEYQMMVSETESCGWMWPATGTSKRLTRHQPLAHVITIR